MRIKNKQKRVIADWNRVVRQSKHCDIEMYDLITFIYERAYETGLYNGKHNDIY